MAGRVLQVVLPDDLDAEISAAVSRGEYPSAAEAVAGAVEEWRASRRGNLPLQVDEVRRLWDEGIAGGPDRDMSIEDIKAEARQRSADLSAAI